MRYIYSNRILIVYITEPSMILVISNTFHYIFYSLVKAALVAPYMIFYYVAPSMLLLILSYHIKSVKNLMPCRDLKVLLKAFLSERIIHVIVHDWKLLKIIM